MKVNRLGNVSEQPIRLEEPFVGICSICRTEKLVVAKRRNFWKFGKAKHMASSLKRMEADAERTQDTNPYLCQKCLDKYYGPAVGEKRHTI